MRLNEVNRHVIYVERVFVRLPLRAGVLRTHRTYTNMEELLNLYARARPNATVYTIQFY